MKRLRLYLVVEGETEQVFARTILQPYFEDRLDIHPARVKTSRNTRGGLHNYERPKKDLLSLFRQDDHPDAFFSCMFDSYELPSGFPNWRKAQELVRPSERATLIEEGLLEDIGHPRGNFIPYIQVHEVEALMLCDLQVLECVFHENVRNVREMWKQMQSFDSPEEINDQRPPSKLLKEFIPEYNKKVDGENVLQRLSILTIRARCPHFSEWLSRLETLGSGAP